MSAINRGCPQPFSIMHRQSRNNFEQRINVFNSLCNYKIGSCCNRFLINNFNLLPFKIMQVVLHTLTPKVKNLKFI